MKTWRFKTRHPRVNVLHKRIPTLLPTRSQPHHRCQIRHVFSEKRAAGMPTPYAGVRKLFQAEQARDPETPRLNGVREVLSRARQREPSIPIFEGVDEMLVTLPDDPSQEPAGQSDEVDAPEVAAPAPTRLLPEPQRRHWPSACARAGKLPLTCQSSTTN
ncbi:hypothetical protein EDB83DRAFT_1509029 [Lactarius deliciosus]|nr:hypothetical protein EDB83DRAFT_1509029 [Lactarius deliciosus]